MPHVRVSVKRTRLTGLILALAIAAGAWYAQKHLPRSGPQPWNSNAIRANYVGAQVREIDPQHASLVLAYELQNDTDGDYRLSNAAGFVFMSRLKADHSLSSQQTVRLANATFLPARQQARVALEIDRPFSWPAENDPLLPDKLEDFVRQGLAGVESYVLFDQTDRCQIEFPSGWQALQLASEAGSRE
jgi:hypothetical protein